MKKIMSILLTLAMLCSFAVVPVSAETTLPTQVGEDGKTYYLIGSADDYLAFVTEANADLSINGKLTADIDMSAVTNKAIYIGNYGKGKTDSNGVAQDKPYTGIFDGDYHIIRNISVAKSLINDSNAAVGIFNMTSGATIKNLGVENALIENTYGGSSSNTRNYWGGVLVGYGTGTTKIENCYVKNSTIKRPQGGNGAQWQYAGFIAAQLTSTTEVNNCYSVNNTYSFGGSSYSNGGGSVAGFVGFSGGKVTNSYAKGTTFPSNSKPSAFSRLSAGTIFPTCYTDVNKVVGSSYSCGANVTTEWSTLAATLGSAFKNDTYNLNSGAPRLSWEIDPAVYTVTVADTIVGGSVSADSAEVAEGETVALTVTPASDVYKVATVTVNGEEIASPYTFTMPANDVTVNATFEKRWANGEGTEESPIIISTIAELKELATAVNGEKHFEGVYFELANDLDFDGVTDFGTIGQIGSSAQSDVRWFSGNFDGKNHIIKNLTINTSQRYVALFGQVKNATIKNIGIENSTFRQQGNYYAAGVAVLASNSEISGCFVKNTTINVKAAKGSNPQNAGGIVAQATGTTTITDCYAKDITLRTETDDVYFNGAAGGIAGQISGTAKITNCYATGIKFTKAGSNIANIARVNGDNALVTNAYAEGKLGKDSASVTVIAADSDEWLKLADSLGSAFKKDTYGANGGRPTFTWEAEPTTVYSVIISDSITNGTVKANYEKAVEGATVRLSVTADENAELESVTVNGEALEAPYTFVMPAGDVTVNAVFTKQNVYTVTVADSIVGGSVNADKETAIEGETVALTVTPENDVYKLTAVTVNGEEIASPYTFVMPANDVTVNATFEKRWANGEGTEESPIIISTIDELNELRNAVNGEKHFEGVYFELANDLDFDGVEFGTIGQIGSSAQSDVRRFSGNFDGKNHIIKNLTINTSQRYVALFGQVKNATIKNLGIEDSYFRQQGNYYAASLAVIAEKSVISNCYVKDTTVRIKSESNGEATNSQAMGGLIAQTTGNTTVTDCYAKNVTVALDHNSKGLNSAAGGLVGYLSTASSITNCYTAEIKFNINTSGNVAYLAREYGENTITNSYVTAKAARDTDSVTVVTEKELRSASLLGGAFVADVDMVNGGLPMLKWEVTAEPKAKFIFTGFVTTEEGAVSGVKLEKYDSSSVNATVYAAVKEGDSLKKVVLASASSTVKGNNTVTFSENITLGENETLAIYVWDNDVNPLMYVGE